MSGIVSADWALQKALFAELGNDSEVQLHLGSPVRLFDEVPRREFGVAEFPYAAFTEHRLDDNAATGCEKAYSHDITIEVFSRYHGRREVKDCLGTIRQVIESLSPLPASLILDDHRLTLIHTVFSDVFRLQDGLTMRGIIKIRALTEAL